MEERETRSWGGSSPTTPPGLAVIALYLGAELYIYGPYLYRGGAIRSLSQLGRFSTMKIISFLSVDVHTSPLCSV